MQLGVDPPARLEDHRELDAGPIAAGELHPLQLGVRHRHRDRDLGLSFRVDRDRDFGIEVRRAVGAQRREVHRGAVGGCHRVRGDGQEHERGEAE